MRAKKLEYNTLLSRVKQEVIHFQYNSEIIIIFAELGLLSILLIRYFTIQSLHASTHFLLSDPFVLFLFGGVVLIRWIFLYTGKLTHFILGIFVIAEMCIILYGAYTHKIEFDAANHIILSTNTRYINFIFLIIALRTLRFDPLMVLLSGLTAAIGWLMITFSSLHDAGVSILHFPRQDPVFFIYLTQEIGRIIIILIITAILTIALYRARLLLWGAVTDSNAIKDLSRFFDSDIAEKITQAKSTLQVGEGEKRNAAVLFVDMRGFTKTTEMLSPTEVILLLSEYQTLIVPIIQKHNGTIDKFMGDGIMASFGATSDSTTYAADALRTVDDIVKAAKIWRQNRADKKALEIDIGAGLAIGLVVFGVVGDAERLEYTIIGNPVNLAAKLEKQNKIEHSHAIATRQTLDTAIAQGYENHLWPTQSKHSKIEDFDTTIETVFLP